MRRATLLVSLTLLAAPALARDSLGMFGSWGAFRDPQASGGPRCYAIAMAAPSTLQRDYQPYAAIGTWPRQQVRGQIHFRLSRKLQPSTPITLIMSGQRYQLVGGGGDAWAADKRMDAAIVAAMRSAGEMTVSPAPDTMQRLHRFFADLLQLSPEASAIASAAR